MGGDAPSQGEYRMSFKTEITDGYVTFDVTDLRGKELSLAHFAAFDDKLLALTIFTNAPAGAVVSLSLEDAVALSEVLDVIIERVDAK